MIIVEEINQRYEHSSSTIIDCNFYLSLILWFTLILVGLYEIGKLFLNVDHHIELTILRLHLHACFFNFLLLLI